MGVPPTIGQDPWGAQMLAYLSHPSRLDGKGESVTTDALRYFRTQFARRETVPCDIICVGDSLTEGQGATGIATRWVDRFKTTLRARYQPAGITGGYGYVPVRNISSTFSYNMVTNTLGAYSGDYGLGRHCRFVNASGALSQLASIQSTRVDVIYEQGGGGVFQPKLNGSNAGGTVNTAGAVQQVAYTIPGLTSGANVVEVDWVSGNNIICGFMVYNGDENAGIRVWCGAQGAQTSFNFADPAKPRWIDGVALVQPALLLLQLGPNDFKSSVPVSTFQTQMTTIITNIRAVSPSTSICIQVSYALGAAGSYQTWLTYVAALQAIADADGMIALFDVNQRFGPQAPPSAPGMIYTDQQHPTDAGHLLWSDALVNFLIP